MLNLYTYHTDPTSLYGYTDVGFLLDIASKNKDQLHQYFPTLTPKLIADIIQLIKQKSVHTLITTRPYDNELVISVSEFYWAIRHIELAYGIDIITQLDLSSLDEYISDLIEMDGDKEIDLTTNLAQFIIRAKIQIPKIKKSVVDYIQVHDDMQYVVWDLERFLEKVESEQ
jgi:hypothetical protein